MRAVIVERAYAAIGPHDVTCPDRLRQIGVRDIAEVIDFLARDARIFVFRHRHIGGADQRKRPLIGDHEDDPVVRVLQDVGMLLRMHTWNHDVAAFDVSHVFARGSGTELVAHLLDPWTGGIDKRLRSHADARARALAKGRAPDSVLPLRGHKTGARTHVRAQLACGDGVNHHQARIVDARIRVHKTLSEFVLQARTPLARLELDAER